MNSVSFSQNIVRQSINSNHLLSIYLCPISMQNTLWKRNTFYIQLIHAIKREIFNHISYKIFYSSYDKSRRDQSGNFLSKRLKWKKFLSTLNFRYCKFPSLSVHLIEGFYSKVCKHSELGPQHLTVGKFVNVIKEPRETKPRVKRILIDAKDKSSNLILINTDNVRRVNREDVTERVSLCLLTLAILFKQNK